VVARLKLRASLTLDELLPRLHGPERPTSLAEHAEHQPAARVLVVDAGDLDGLAAGLPSLPRLASELEVSEEFLRLRSQLPHATACIDHLAGRGDRAGRK